MNGNVWETATRPEMQRVLTGHFKILMKDGQLCAVPLAEGCFRAEIITL